MSQNEKKLSQKTCIPCQGGIPPLPLEKTVEFLKELSNNWIHIDNHHIEKEYSFNTFPEAIAFTNKVADLAESEGHHPYIHINFKTVKIIVYTHKINGLHESDFILAAKCDLI